MEIKSNDEGGRNRIYMWVARSDLNEFFSDFFCY